MAIVNDKFLVLDSFVSMRPNDFQGDNADLLRILNAVSLCAKMIYSELSRAAVMNISGAAGSENVQGEVQQKLDVISNDLFIKYLTQSGRIAAIASEENDDIIFTGNDKAEYVLAMDPLDGSSNIDVNVPVGTIFSVFRRLTPAGTKPDARDFLRKGSEQILAGYVLYGTAMMFVYSTGKGVHSFIHEPTIGEFLLSETMLSIPKNGKIYSCNEAQFKQFNEQLKNYIEDCRTLGYSTRYIGSLVADFHRNMQKGGIFLYPGTAKNPNGKLRLLYECNPLAFIAEQAGGAATDGLREILDIKAESLHQRVPYIVGSQDMVEKCRNFGL
jgi:fructose-1,6-bisphosphatase I